MDVARMAANAAANWARGPKEIIDNEQCRQLSLDVATALEKATRQFQHSRPYNQSVLKVGARCTCTLVLKRVLVH